MKKKALSLLLALVMVLSMLPVSSLATGLWGDFELSEDMTAEAEEITLTSDTSDDFYRILHLDCGRKYFSKDWIIALLYEMQAAGYTQLQLAFGNDGLRFLLDDMSFTANGTTYAHETVVAKVESGNAAAQKDGNDSRWLTQTEMDEIIAKANELKIDIVPLLNLPGHANAICNIADNSFNFTGSAGTLNVVGSVEAENYALAIVKKYVSYFADKGCKFFNVGADEFANDINNNPYFGNLTNTQYSQLVYFVNQMAKIVEDAGMTPRAFNDPMYYEKKTSSTALDTSIQCCYWSSGWNGYDVASASTIAGNGHAMINTNGDYYYVLGKDDKFDSGYSYASNFNNTTFMESTISDPVGSMFCIWCDYPNAETEAEVAQKVRLPLRAMAARMQDKSIDDISTDVVTNGFNADGSIYKPETESKTVYDDASNVSVTAPGLTKVSVVPNAAVTENNKVTKTYSITLNDGAYTGAATVKIPYASDFDGYTSFYGLVGSDRFDVTLSDGVFVCEVPHFSDVTIVAEQQDTTTTTKETINLTVGGTETKQVSGTYTSPATDNAYIASVAGTNETIGSSTSYNLVTELKAGTFYVYNNANATAPTTELTLEAVGDGTYYLKNSSGGYFYPTATHRIVYWSYSVKSVTSKSDATAVSVVKSSVGYVFSCAVSDKDLINDTKTTTAYLSWTKSNGFASSGNSSTLYLYEKDEVSGQQVTNLTFTGTGEGTTTATIGDVEYTINVTVTPTTATESLVYGGSFELPAGAEVEDTYDSTVVTVAGGKVTALQKDGETTVTVVTKNAGGKVTARSIYAVKVTKENLANVSALTLEHWITNTHVYSDADRTSGSETNISAEIAYGENGVAVSGLAFNPGYSQSSSDEVAYWKAVRLPSSNKQTTASNTDKSSDGTILTHVRYYQSKWSYKTAAGSWVDFASGDQLVAYYVQKQNVTKEITSYFKDWGHAYNTTPNGGSYGYVGLTVAVVYPDGTLSPKEDTMKQSSTTIFNYWSNRNIGVIIPKNNSDYSISKITVTDGTGNCASWSGSFTWDKKTLEDGESQWFDETVVWDKTYETDPIVDATDGTNSKLVWQGSNTAKLILIYLEVEEKDTNLNVVWYDQTANTQITSMQVAMKYSTGEEEPTYTTALKDASGSVIGGTKNWPGKTSTESTYLPDGAYVTNAANVNQTFNKDLVTNTLVSGVYKSGIYKYNGAVISDDGKTLTLNYVVDNSRLNATYVVDFGLPVKINVNDIAQNVTDVTFATQPATGTVTYANGVITCTPTKTLSGAETLVCTFHYGNDTNTMRIGLVPASNVLYEETFFTAESGWEKKGTTPTTAQQTQKVDGTGEYYVFGRDSAYDQATGAQGYYEATGLSTKAITSKLTTSFYGNAFDLIGNCGTNTGRVLMLISGNNKNYIYDVDTRYNDGNGTILNQVPLAHAELGIDATYNVTICAAGLDATTASDARAASTFSVSGGSDALTLFLAENDLTASQVEIISVTPDLTAYASAVSVNDTAEATAVSHAKGTHVEIDAFRVYRSSDNTSYPEAEQNVKYVNCLDAVDGEFVAYTESNGTATVTVETYEGSGGPQNEIYLANGQSVTFGMLGADKVQVSLRAVNNSATYKFGDGQENTISTNTEMYYEVTTTGNGMFTIYNSDEGLLAIGNLKLDKNAVVQAASDFSVETILYSVQTAMASAPVESEPEYDPFVDVKVRSTSLLRKKLVTLTITTSTDVEALTVNGYKLYPVNKWMVQSGRATTYTYILADTVSKKTTKTYEITAVNANGQSCTVTKQA